MNKRNLTLTLLLACMLVGTMAFAETASVRLGANYVALTSDASEDAKIGGYELTGKVWFAELPQLTISGSYSSLDLKVGDNKVSTYSDIAVVGEYRVYNETNYGFSVNAGWLNKGETSEIPADAEREADNYLTVGGKGNYVLAEGLQAIAGVSYGFNNLFKEEADPEVGILSFKVGAEYDLAQVPGLKFSASYLSDKYTEKVGEADPTETTLSGFNVGASYAFSF